MHTTSTSSFTPLRILILGMGDLGVKIAQLALDHGLSSTCILAGHSEAASQWAQLLHLSTGREVRGLAIDGEDLDALKQLLVETEPQLIVQCATLLSPYALSTIGSEAAKAVLRGGFALQLAAQLPIIRNVMLARRELGMTCPVINCSYPDATNAILATEGLAPDSGIGNVSIMALRFSRLLELKTNDDLQVIGHHAQLGPSLAGVPAAPATPVPLVYVNGRKLPASQLLIDTGLKAGPTLNHLAAATTLPILRGFVLRDQPLRTHAPGISGLPGGYPIQFTDGTITLRLPAEVTLQDAVAFNQLAAKGEGVEEIATDGTVTYTEAAREAVSRFCPELAEPLKITHLTKRLEVLKSILHT